MPSVLWILAGIVAGYFFLCYLLARKFVQPGGKHAEPPDGFERIQNPDVWLSTSLDPDRAVFVLVHGYQGSQVGWTEVAQSLRRRGYGVVVPALPGHGGRPKERSGFAVKESEIVVEVVDWIRHRVGKDAKIVLVGISMGGAACWLATEKDPQIYAVVSEGSFARLGPATRRWFNRKAPGASIALYPVTLMAQKMTGVNPKEVNPVESAAKWTGKSLVIHGDHDSLFSIDDARELAEAAGGELWIVEGAGHAHCSGQDVDVYTDRLVALVED